MSHRPIFIQSLGLSFPQKVCFSGFSTQVHDGMRIAIIGQNGSGKTTLLKMLHGLVEASEGYIHLPEDVSIGYVPQVIEDFTNLSGGQRFNEALTKALVLHPTLLLLDEPTNHLDVKNRRSLMRLLRKFPGTLIVVSHDVESLRSCMDTFWHIAQGKITIFSGHYDAYREEVSCQRSSLEHELGVLERDKKQTHLDLMKEQNRAKKSRSTGEKHIEQRKWPTIVSNAKANKANETSGCKKKQITTKKQELVEKLEKLILPEMITPKFSLKASDVSSSKTIVTIREGSCGYITSVLEEIFLSLEACDRLAITGNNGTGKSTLVRAILGDDSVKKTGDWIGPKREEIGYLDQHYSTLNSQKTVLETMQEVVPDWSHGELRRHLNDFLFRKNEEVTARVSTLSGGEKARLCLSQIAARTPKLLILDEMTNNLDLETRAHVIQVLQNYPGAMIIISHDSDFLTEVRVKTIYDLGTKEKRK